MKQMILGTMILFLIGCAGGGGSGGDSGTAPDILSVEFYQYVDGERVVKTTFIIDEIFSVRMLATDPDRDMERYFVSISGVGDSKQRSRTIPPADTDTIEIYDYQRNVYDYADQFGDHRACFFIVDAEGNESEDFCITITVVDYPTPS